LRKKYWLLNADALVKSQKLIFRPQDIVLLCSVKLYMLLLKIEGEIFYDTLDAKVLKTFYGFIKY